MQNKYIAAPYGVLMLLRLIVEQSRGASDFKSDSRSVLSSGAYDPFRPLPNVAIFPHSPLSGKVVGQAQPDS